MKTIEENKFIQAEMKEIEEGWRHTESIMEMLQGKAEQRGVSIDSMMKIDVMWMIEEKIRNGELFCKGKQTQNPNNQDDLQK